jgi:hypothetical protein
MRKISKPGFTVVEVIIAAAILIIAIFPFMRAIGTSAKSVDTTEKTQMANKFLQSIKNELVAMKFKEFALYAQKIGPEPADGYILDDMFFPGTWQNLQEFQKKYRDFKVSGNFKFVARKKNPLDRSVIFVNLEISWDDGKQKKTDSITIVDSKT